MLTQGTTVAAELGMQALARVVAGLACARALTTPSASIGSTGVLGSTVRY